MLDSLAIIGGTPVGDGLCWPEWPRYDEETEASILAALRSRRWAVSWTSIGEPSRSEDSPRHLPRTTISRIVLASITDLAPSSWPWRLWASDPATRWSFQQ